MELLDEFLAYQSARGNGPGIVRAKRLSLGKAFSHFARRRIIHAMEVTPRHVNDYRAKVLRRRIAGEPLSSATLWSFLGPVRQYFAFLVRRKIIFANPAERLTWPKRPSRLPAPMLTEKEVQEILAKPDIKTAMGLRDRAILELFYSTGIRRAELARLDMGDVDMAHGLLTVRRGKWGRDRVVPVGKTACDFLAQYLQDGRRMAPLNSHGKPYRRGGPTLAFFVSEQGGRFHPASLNPVVQKYIRGVRPGQKLGCHAFRHACATHMLRGGAHIRLIQELLGHRKLETTQIYASLCPLDLKKAHDQHHPHGCVNSEKARFRN